MRISREWQGEWSGQGRALVPRRGHPEEGPGGGLLGAGTSEPEGEPEDRGPREPEGEAEGTMLERLNYFEKLLLAKKNPFYSFSR